MYSRSRHFLFALLCFLLTVHTVSATIINVPAEQPTIQEGIFAASLGDTVLVAPGIYNENISIYGKIVGSWFVTTQDTSYISKTTLVDEYLEAGNHSVMFDGSGLPSGLYFCNLKACGFIETRKMVLVK